MEQSTIMLLIALVGGAASLIAIARGLEELTSGARVRSFEAVLRANLDAEDPDPVLTSLHRATLAKLVARDAVHGGRFIVPVAFTVAFTLLGGTVLIVTGQQPFWPDTMVTLVALIGALGFSVRDWVFLTAERARIVRAFQHGVVPLRAYTDSMAHWSKGGFKPLRIGFGTSLGYGMFVLGAGQLLKVSPEIPDTPAATLALVGAGLTVFSLARGVGHITRTDLIMEPDNQGIYIRPTWVHPFASAPYVQREDAGDDHGPRARE
ncbi:hypothetical protein [Tessaracoccus sp. MC1756]|uniref:hypothetical protein n=1 Tax=Tessaracoccus sp. MC1756 TaxID=2760311 RepID=UPI001600E0F4|nr:hypothetical protein [Tessaracoccus sp. MC1756]MBB1510619.1 hypothetical protein [Tessaracoccus sp. MC1756]